MHHRDATSTAHLRVGPPVYIDKAEAVSEQPNPDGTPAVARFHVWFSQALDHQASVDFQPYTLAGLHVGPAIAAPGTSSR